MSHRRAAIHARLALGDCPDLQLRARVPVATGRGPALAAPPSAGAVAAGFHYYKYPTPDPLATAWA